MTVTKEALKASAQTRTLNGDGASVVPPAEGVTPLGLLASFLDPLMTKLPGLAQGLANLSRVLPEPKEMHGAEMHPGVMLMGRDGNGVSLNAPRLPVTDVPFRSLVAMVERLNDPHVSNVVIQDIKPMDRYQGQKPLIVGHINPFYSVIAIRIAEQSDPSKVGGGLNRLLRYYVQRHELAACYLIAKMHLQGLQELAAVEAQLAGWGMLDIPYAIDSFQDTVHRDQLHGSR